MKKILIAVLLFAMPVLCFAQASDNATEAMKNVENRCTRHGSVIARVFELYLAKTPPKEICVILEKEYKLSENSCKAAMEQVLELREDDAKMTAKQAGEAYFSACMESEK